MIYVLIFISLLAALLTFELSKIEKIGAIRASAGLTLFSFIDFSLINYFYEIDVNYFMAAFFGATFVGMSCPTKFGYKSIGIGASFYALFFYNLVPLLPGMGGALGTSAFLGVITTLIAKKTLRKT